jgi:hypothetical protein
VALLNVQTSGSASVGLVGEESIDGVPTAAAGETPRTSTPAAASTVAKNAVKARRNAERPSRGFRSPLTIACEFGVERAFLDGRGAL